MKVTDEMVRAAWRVLWHEGVTSPYMARSADYPNREALKAADAEAERMNDEVMRKALEAALAARDE